MTTQHEKKDTSFNTRVNIPAGEHAYFWLTYDKQLERSKAKYNYKTHLNTFGDVKNLEIIVKIAESRALKSPNVTAEGTDFSRRDISEKEVIFEWSNMVTNYDEEINIEYDIVRLRVLNNLPYSSRCVPN